VEVWCVPSATDLLLCVFDIRMTLSASERYRVLLKLTCESSCVMKGGNRISWFELGIWKLVEMRREPNSDLSPNRGKKD
jgi:hypothetical protein